MNHSAYSTQNVYNASMSPRVSRRNLVLLLSAAPLFAQTQTAAPPVTPEQRLEKAKADVRQVSDQLSAITVPMNIEPAFRFVA
jgi:hypothetical protein